MSQLELKIEDDTQIEIDNLKLQILLLKQDNLRYKSDLLECWKEDGEAFHFLDFAQGSELHKEFRKEFDYQ